MTPACCIIEGEPPCPRADGGSRHALEREAAMIVTIGVDEGLHVTLDTDDDHGYPGGDVTSDLCVRAQVLFAAVMADARVEATE